MYRILLPVDESEDRARAQVAAVRELPEAADEITVDVLYVEEDAAGGDTEWAAGGFSDEFAAEMEALDHDEHPKSVPTAAEELESAGIEWSVRTASGNPATAILAAASEYESDAIVLGVQQRSPVGKVLFGSVTQAVILDSDLPVTVVPVV